MQFFNQLCSVVRRSRPLNQRANLLNETQRFIVGQSIRAIASRSENEVADDIWSSIPEKPKKPASSFIRFIKRVEPEIVKQDPGVSRREIVRKASQMWKGLDKETLLSIQSEYFAEMGLYKEAVVSYESKLTAEQKEALNTFNSIQKEAKSSKKLKKTLEELGKPKKPPNAFLLFAQTKKSEIASANVVDWSTKAGKEWKDLPEQEKNMFLEKAIKLREKYKQVKEEWIKKIEESGNAKLLTPKVKVKAPRKKSERSISKDALSENMVCGSSTTSVGKVICSHSKADKKKDRGTISDVSSKKEYNHRSSPSSMCDITLKNNSRIECIADHSLLDKVNPKSKQDFTSKVLFFLDTYLTAKYTVHFVIGVTFFSAFIVLPLYYFLC